MLFENLLPRLLGDERPTFNCRWAKMIGKKEKL